MFKTVCPSVAEGNK